MATLINFITLISNHFYSSVKVIRINNKTKLYYSYVMSYSPNIESFIKLVLLINHNKMERRNGSINTSKKWRDLKGFNVL